MAPLQSLTGCARVVAFCCILRIRGNGLVWKDGSFRGNPPIFAHLAEAKNAVCVKYTETYVEFITFGEKLLRSTRFIFAFWLVMFVRIRYNCY